MDKTALRKRVFKYLKKYGKNIEAKLTNICGKTGSYGVPLELFQKRTSRKNRALITWRAVKENHLTIEQLDTFEGGVVVEFVNNDFFDTANFENEVFNELKSRIGSNDNVSSIISIKSEAGSSSSAKPREAFMKLVNNTVIHYKGSDIVINKENYTEYALSQDIRGKGQGNETWRGFLFVSIRGGQQDKIETHSGQELTLFNPACEYACSDVCEDINLVMSYYALISIDKKEIKEEREYNFLIHSIESMLKTIQYDNDSYTGNLLDYVKKQYTVSLISEQLTDPIQLARITIDKFNISARTEDSLDFTHEEAVILEKYYWDKIKKCVLSPARPTNVFWSYHLSNMMQQNYSLDDYFKYEEQRFQKRQELIEKSRKL